MKCCNNHTLRHRWLEFETEIHQFSLKISQEQFGVVVREEVSIRHFIVCDEFFIGLLSSVDDLVFAFEDPKFSVRACWKHLQHKIMS